MDRPKDIADLMANWKQLGDLIEFAQAWKNGEFIAPSGERIPVLFERGSKNAVIDGRALTATGEQIFPAIPSQTGKAGYFLSTTGSLLTWGLGPAMFTHVRRAASQSIPTGGVFTQVSWDSVVENPDGVFNAGTPTRLTIPAGADGVWQFSMWMRYDINATGIRYCYLRKNALTPLQIDLRNATSGGNYTYMSLVGTFRLVAGEYVDLNAFQDSGGALNLLTAGGSAAEITAIRLRS